MQRNHIIIEFFTIFYKFTLQGHLFYTSEAYREE
jgi:hypothetical protein